MAKQEVADVISELELTFESTFVPFSKSRHKDDVKSRWLNWKVTIYCRDRMILTTDYSVGEGHCPSYKQGLRTLDRQEAIEWETEHGRGAIYGSYYSVKPIVLDTIGFIVSLVSDAEVLDFSSFESWATDLGYDPDSISAKKVYDACLQNALALRAGVGEEGLTKLRKACQNY